jgi:murein DD-endopeptidase MepM/ murein hydrolase activator NlpD
MRLRTVLSLAALLAAVGCASNPSPAPVQYGGSPRPAPAAQASTPSVPSPDLQAVYAAAPALSVPDRLLLCKGSVSNPGPVGASGEVAGWTAWMTVPSGQLLRKPTQAACLSSGFGWRGVASGAGRQHFGIDLANPAGGFVYAAGGGNVLAAGLRGGFGLTVELDHGAGVRTLYAHLADINPAVRPGVWASPGAAIGRMGRTGNATGVHLHYEVFVDGVRVDPLTYGLTAEPLLASNSYGSGAGSR